MAPPTMDSHDHSTVKPNGSITAATVIADSGYLMDTPTMASMP